MDRVQRRLTVPAALAGRRLDQAVAALLPEFSRSRLKYWIDSGSLTVGGQRAKPKTVLRGGEQVELSAELETETAAQPENIPLAILHEDEALFVIDKPIGLVVHPGAGNRSGTLQNALLHFDPALAKLPRAGLVHRLDKDTSGLLLVARTLEAQTALAAALEKRIVRRTYEAICQGVLAAGGTVDAAIGRHPRERTKMAVVARGRPARTHYRVLERFRAHTHCEVTLDTGRTHQIRVHMAHIRAPLVGDPVYGGRPRLPPNASEALRTRLQSFGRQALHATRLAFDHPVSRAPMTFTSELAPDLKTLLAALRADAAEHRS